MYVKVHWEGLPRFLTDGRIPWTNNESERLLRHVVVGVKAWHFRGSFGGARRGCILWSLTQSCRTHRMNPRRYLLETLEALTPTPESRVSTLTPKAYASRPRPLLAAA
jgi:transposase